MSEKSKKSFNKLLHLDICHTPRENVLQPNSGYRKLSWQRYIYCWKKQNTSIKYIDGKDSDVREQCCRLRLLLTGRRLIVSERVPPTQKGRSGCGAVDFIPTRSRGQPPHGVSKQRVSQRTSRSR